MPDFDSKPTRPCCSRRERSRLHVTLNRPQVKNALNPTLIGELRTVSQNLRDPGTSNIKVVILRGAGGTFCAGADLKNVEQSLPRSGSASGTRSRSATANTAPSSRW